MTTLLDPIFVSDSQLFRVSVYDTDGAALVTPQACTCAVYNRTTGASVASGSGVVGAGYAQYNWSGSATAGEFEAVLSVTISAGVVNTEAFWVTVQSKPQVFTIDLTTDIGKVRMELGDHKQGDGVRPDSSNLSDEEIDVLLDREGSVMRAVAAACELLARAWSRVANINVGNRREDLGAVAEQWRKQAELLRTQYGGASDSVTAFSIGAKRADGYAELLSDGEYTP